MCCSRGWTEFQSIQDVLTGEPVAVMRGGAQLAALLATGSSQLYIEFRKDGTPIDPSLWWAASEN
jgi:septal ring factor EnvC (AmiA/AmiB activator)